MKYMTFVQAHFDIKATSENTRNGGTEALVFCPFHKSGSPHMYINLDSGRWICHSCHEAGPIERLAELMDTTVNGAMTPVDTLRRRLHASNQPLSGPLRLSEDTLDQFDFPTGYWAERGLTADAVKLFQLGYDPEQDDYIIPLRDSHTRLLGVIRRRSGKRLPKYMYPEGFAIGKHLFGSWLVRRTKFSRVALVEGSIDAIANWDAGVPTMGVLGSRITDDQVHLLRSLHVRTVVLMMDDDSPGQGFPDHWTEPKWSRRKDSWKCQVCGRLLLHSNRQRCKATGQFQMKAALTGISVHVGKYIDGWDRDPASLTQDQRKRMFERAQTWRRWKSEYDQDVSYHA